MAIIDSPLFQRLRLIRQLGVAHWVYPGATHTRFEHSLGVLFQTQQLANALNAFPKWDKPSSDTSLAVSNTDIQLLRLSALVHDIGHPCFSHVAEKAIMNFSDYQLTCVQFQEKTGADNPKLAEIASFYLVSSSSFKRLIDAALRQLKTPLLIDDMARNTERIIERISRCILGLPISNRFPTLQDIISGPFDADKLDYIARDALYCGIPNIVDISRLLQKLTIVFVPPDKLPRRIARGVTAGEHNYALFGLKQSGAQVLDELTLGRALLFSKVYRHHKVRAHEAMVEAIFRVMSAMSNSIDLLSIGYKFGDEELLSLNPATLSTCLAAKQVIISQTDLALAKCLELLLTRLRDRNPFVKVMHLEITYTDDPYGASDAQSKGLKTLRVSLTNAEKLREFKNILVSSVYEILSKIAPLLLGEMIGIQEDIARISSKEALRILDALIVISPQMISAGSSEVSRALVISQDAVIAPYESRRFNTDAWASAYDTSVAASGYVFSPRELASFVYIGLERSCFKVFKVILPPSALQTSKILVEDVEEEKRRLAGRGFFSSLPVAMRPTPPRLCKADVEGRVRSIARKFAVYQQPRGYAPDHEIKGDIEQKIVFWLKQFDEDRYIDIGLEMLEKVKILSRDDVVESVKAFFYNHPEYNNANVCGFGSLKDSAAIVSYFANDIGKPTIARVATIHEIIENDLEGPIVFFDDFCASGGQARDQLTRWFDQQSDVELGEERFPFNERQQQFLRKRKIAFLFVAAWDTGLAAVEDVLKSIGLDAVCYAFIRENEIPFAFDNIAYTSKPVDVRAFKKKCEEIGIAMQAESDGRDKAKSRALGYGNRAMLLAFPYNVPAQTLTVIRHGGLFREVPWEPIFHRRKKT